MVVLAASICTKGGKAVISRQFHQMSRTRIESLLSSFPKLIPASSQHTTVETSEVRYVYQPLEDLYILLITNKGSNILQDIDTLHLFARVVSDLCRSADEREILGRAFEIVGAFDEIISLGYRESVNLMQVRNVLEMESHEEKIQEIIAKNKEAEAKEELKRRAKQLEMQRREQQRRAAGSGGAGYLGSNGGGVTGYSPVPRYEAPESITRTNSLPASVPKKSTAFKGSGMKLGSSKTKQAELLDALGGDLAELNISAPATPTAPTSIAESVPKASDERGSIPAVEQESVHVHTSERINLSLLRDGGVQNMTLKGDMNLLITDPELAHLSLRLGELNDNFAPNALQFKQHPNVAKFAPKGEGRVVRLKDSKQAFPVNQSLAVLKWRYAGTDESVIPLSINAWPTPTTSGTVEMSIEYELENPNVELFDVEIGVPLPDGSYPTVTSHSGEWSLNPMHHSLTWSIAHITTADATGSIVFTVPGDDTGAFFPVEVAFVGKGSLAGISVEAVVKVGEGEGEDVVFSQDDVLGVDEYLVV